VQRALDIFEERGVKPAAFVIDTISSCGGVVSPPPGYLSRVAEIVRDAGALFIADEVQPGFGRTGTNFWGFEVDGFVPDFVTMGKPMGNGHPLSAVATRKDLVDEFSQRSDYFNTFGGNPVSCAAGLAVLDVIEDENLQQNALEVGQHLVDGLWQLAEAHECIGDVRGTGLFLAVELVTSRNERTPASALARKVINDLRAKGVLTGTIGPDDNILKLRSPMVLSKDDAEYFLGILDSVLKT
ncbi:MAG: aminotransferase class III-fold pyridoxal phosphate-dependent enzyme, partial [Desulfobacterales bacterium]|nr:aminotransferase class III-fold pyridoxal phosphate-dependent enzyme [Desulfobacterales bacterium]